MFENNSKLPESIKRDFTPSDDKPKMVYLGGSKVFEGECIIWAKMGEHKQFLTLNDGLTLIGILNTNHISVIWI